MLGGEEAANGCGAARPRVLFLCWEKVAHGAAAQRLMSADRWPFEVIAVETGEGWRRLRFASQVDEVDRLLDDFAIAVGHGYDAWVLMAAAEQRTARGVTVPFLLLLNPVLGASQHLNGSLVGYRAPRGPRVRAAFGLDREEDGQRALIERAAYVFGDNDRHSSQADWRYLRGLGSQVHTIAGWHQRNWREIEEQLREVFATYALDIGELLGSRAAKSEVVVGRGDEDDNDDDDDDREVLRVAGS